MIQPPPPVTKAMISSDVLPRRLLKPVNGILFPVRLYGTGALGEPIVFSLTVMLHLAHLLVMSHLFSITFDLFPCFCMCFAGIQSWVSQATKTLNLLFRPP